MGIVIQQESFFDRAKAAHQRLEESRAEGSLRRLSPEDELLLKRHRDAFTAFAKLCEDRGKRYAGCRFDNYDIGNAKQRKVVEALRHYAADADSLASGRNVLLFGSKGTGKDHLGLALSREVVHNHGTCASWRNGTALHTDLKRYDFEDKPRYDHAGDDRRPHRVAILWVSDPLPPTGPLTDYQQKLIFELLDERYSQMLPTWLSMNVESRAELESRMGAQTVDRLCHGALVLPCDWPSYRSSGKGANE